MFYAYEFGNALADALGIPKKSCIREEITRALINEVNHELVFHHEDYYRQKNKFQKALQVSYDRALEWIQYYKDYNLDLKEITDLRHFVASHREACIYFLILAKELNQCPS